MKTPTGGSTFHAGDLNPGLPHERWQSYHSTIQWVYTRLKQNLWTPVESTQSALTLCHAAHRSLCNVTDDTSLFIHNTYSQTSGHIEGCFGSFIVSPKDASTCDPGRWQLFLLSYSDEDGLGNFLWLISVQSHISLHSSHLFKLWQYN